MELARARDISKKSNQSYGQVGLAKMAAPLSDSNEANYYKLGLGASPLASRGFAPR